MTLCINCKLDKPTEDFYATNRIRCKACCYLSSRKWAMRNNFNLDFEGYAKLLSEQQGVCAICKGPQRNKRMSTFCVDHVHDDEGRVRDLICDDCNIGLGSFKDNPIALMNAALYVS